MLSSAAGGVVAVADAQLDGCGPLPLDARSRDMIADAATSDAENRVDVDPRDVVPDASVQAMRIVGDVQRCGSRRQAITEAGLP